VAKWLEQNPRRCIFLAHGKRGLSKSGVPLFMEKYVERPSRGSQIVCITFLWKENQGWGFGI
jgi:hypothetical protein